MDPRRGGLFVCLADIELPFRLRLYASDIPGEFLW